MPFLSWLAIVAFGVATAIIYFIPLRYIVLAWGELMSKCKTEVKVDKLKRCRVAECNNQMDVPEPCKFKVMFYETVKKENTVTLAPN